MHRMVIITVREWTQDGSRDFNPTEGILFSEMLIKRSVRESVEFSSSLEKQVTKYSDNLAVQGVPKFSYYGSVELTWLKKVGS